MTWRHLTRVGALALLVGLLLPWAFLSCSSGDAGALPADPSSLPHVIGSGFDLAVGVQSCPAQPGLWLLPLVSVLVLGVSFTMADQLSAAFVTVSASLLALLRLLVTYNDVQAIDSAFVEVALGPGCLVVVGAILVMFGAGGVALLRRSEPSLRVDADESTADWPDWRPGLVTPEEPSPVASPPLSEDARRAEEQEIGDALRLLRDGSTEEKIGARCRLAVICERRTLFEEAVELYETNIRDGARDPAIYERLAVVCRTTGQTERAELVEHEAQRLREARVYSSEQAERAEAPTIFFCRSCWTPLNGTETGCERCGALWQQAS